LAVGLNRLTSASLTPATVLQLQRAYGNRAVGTLLARAPRRRPRGQKGDGLPYDLRAGTEALSGQAMDDVRVHYDSPEPARHQALALTRGTEIHLGPGQEQHLGHEAWHAVQQKRGPVGPTARSAGVAINDEPRLEDEASVMGQRAASREYTTGAGPATWERAAETGASPAPSGGGVMQLLTKTEKEDKVRILKDYVRFTPPAEFPGQYGGTPAILDYKKGLLAKISSDKQIISSLKTKSNMGSDDDDDSWADPSFNKTTLYAAVDAVYARYPAPDTTTIGKTYEEFDKHDCVFAAITHALGLEDDLDTERGIARYFGHREGEVEDSILYRMMERLGWEFHDFGTFTELFKVESGKTAFKNSSAFQGTFIVSEDKNASGTQGHVFVVTVVNTKRGDSFDRAITMYDAQYERKQETPRVGEPGFTVYAWAVKETPASRTLKAAL
jgi:hypothetical protein